MSFCCYVIVSVFGRGNIKWSKKKGIFLWFCQYVVWRYGVVCVFLERKNGYFLWLCHYVVLSLCECVCFWEKKKKKNSKWNYVELTICQMLRCVELCCVEWYYDVAPMRGLVTSVGRNNSFWTNEYPNIFLTIDIQWINISKYLTG